MWQKINIPNGNSFLFCNVYITSKSAMNIIVTHTPIVSNEAMKKSYEPLAEYGVNIFAFDFSGTGKSGGNPKDFSCSSVVSDLDSLVDYICLNYSTNIHLYGNGGIGGMFAQCYAASSKKINSFAQFACVDYRNMLGVGYPYPFVKVLCVVLRFLPMMKITMKPPKYKGFHAEKDNGFYAEMTAKNPSMWKINTKILLAVLDCFTAKDSPVRTSVNVPTLVLKTLHDRYFKPEYFDSYYKSLTCKKKLIEINGVHNSYYLKSEYFCELIYNWFYMNKQIEALELRHSKH